MLTLLIFLLFSVDNNTEFMYDGIGSVPNFTIIITEKWVEVHLENEESLIW